MPLELDAEQALAAHELLASYLTDRNHDLDLRLAAAKSLGTAGSEEALTTLMTFMRVNTQAPADLKQAVILAIGQVLQSSPRRNAPVP